ncbi:D-alanyl-D-alanine carboxypeptidase/D-alanyl-D-alanine-endopeptidase [Rhodanobacter glycinis]|uniref:D-alanyl-D-alanine carboxypeptidase/D-alanyl-D-alanine-endopeptidase n=1 Tax=Rhodanobacter glycinis TaxID=582702 RepID=A0A502C0D0_9GAMM|nr:D-alanyl-D-alanine carboxypeptidase/D-alanyl-D-alanine-endopeptidase [Rhodanobacter glycinis]TPG05401.1 D-alanyl-D-alanine carboxypeptidase/D-alanyl-D-alanine-endopeptidase [Rhodanobacter glycinis]
MIPLPRRCPYRFSVCAPIIAVCLLAVSMPAAAAALATPGASTVAGLMAQIDARIGQPRFAAASWGIAVVSLDSGRALYTHRADQLLQPASTAKLFTAALSLSALGTDYRIPTRLLADGRIVNGRLNGSLILQGMGDPTLGAAGSGDWAEQLASQAAARGVRFVRGDLIADDSYFAGPSFGSGWEAGDLQSWFAVPSSALSVQENIVNVTVSPGRTPGRPARLDFSPAEARPDLVRQLVTSAAGTPNDINLYRAPGDDTLHAFGSIAADSTAQHFKLAMVDPALVAGMQLRQALKHRGIHLAGKLRVVHWPQGGSASHASAGMLGEVLSPALRDILQQGLKRSQNLYLQNLLLSVGARDQAIPTTGFSNTESRGIMALRQLLAEIGIPASASLIDEGTGLSRRNLVTPNALVRLLVYLAAQPYADVVREALPVAGVDGTLIGHMRRTAAENNVRAKSGSMAYVHCLAGYVTTAAGERLAFAIMLNNYDRPDDAPSIGSDVDEIAVLLANYRGRE